MKRAEFDEQMRKFRWGLSFRQATAMKLPIAVGMRQNWGYVIGSNNVIIADILDRIDVL